MPQYFPQIGATMTLNCQIEKWKDQQENTISKLNNWNKKISKLAGDTERNHGKGGSSCIDIVHTAACIEWKIPNKKNPLKNKLSPNKKRNKTGQQYSENILGNCLLVGGEWSPFGEKL